MTAHKPKVVAAVDFGTHGTGFAWCVVSPMNDDPMTRRVTFGTSYPGARVDHPKNLTAVLVDADGAVVSWGYRARSRWAEASDAGRDAGLGYAYAFKMALKGGGAHPDLPIAGGSVRLDDPVQVRDLIRAYLAEIRAVALEEIGRAGYTDAEVRWCVTVPAIWDEADKVTMREAAALAGFPADEDRLLLSIEPEAGALYCYLRMADLVDGSGLEGPLGLDVDGTRFMVVDCGGGTVDITAYESSSGDTPYIALREIGVATGGRLGSERINHAFRSTVLGRRFGAVAMARLERENAADLLSLSDAFERAKTTAEVERDPDGTAHVLDGVRIDVPPTIWEVLDEQTRRRLTDEAGGKPFRVLLTPPEVEVLFESVTAGVLDKVEEQLFNMQRTAGPGKGGETLVVIGGFAMSGWLREALRRRFGDRHRILVPPHPALAVLEGAVHYAYDPATLVSRRSRYTYGFELAEPWEPGVDSPTRTFRTSDGAVLCRGRFQTAVRRMERVGVDEPFPFVVVPTRTDQSELLVRLFRTRSPDPRYVDEPGSDPIGHLRVDISDSVGTSNKDRPVQLLLYFGRSRIQVEALNPATGRTTTVSVDFERLP